MKWCGYYIAIAVLMIPFFSQAQYNSRLGRFQVDEKKGCASLTVTITMNAGFQCDPSNPCQMIWGDGTQNVTTFTHTYSQPGTYTLQILFQTIGFDDIQITVTPNTPAQFDLYTCGGNEISVNITDTSYQQYVIDYDDGTQVIVPVGSLAKDNHTFAASGNHTVTVRGRNLSADDNCNSASKIINALVTLPASSITQLQVIDATTIQLALNTQQNILYKLEIATNTAGPFQFLKNVYNSTSEIISNLRTDDNYYCFRIGTFDPCNNTTNYSPTICSSNVDLNIQNNSNTFTWLTSATGISNFRLTITTSGSSLTTTVTGSSYVDTNIICGTNYCYQLVTNYPNGSSSISLQKCGTAISTDVPDAIFNTTAVVDVGKVDLEWQAVPNFTAAEYAVYKVAGGNTTPLTTTTNLFVTDDTYTTEPQVCYQIKYSDVCDNQSPLSSPVCPIRLFGDVSSDNSISLNWSAYSGWRNGVADYVLEKYSESGQLLQSISGAATTYVDDTQDLTQQTYIYVVRANASEAGLNQAVSNRVVIIKDPNLFYPTAFTPNGDNLNDVFNVYGQYITKFEMNIFNRWGELMFTTNLLDQGWDGNYRGSPMPEGTYTFVADIKDQAGRSFTKSGSVLLLRRNK
jgi:gliding motility-associated-like protein